MTIGRDGRQIGLEFPQTVRTTIAIDSRDRRETDASSSSFTVDIPDLLNVTSARVIAAEIPLTYYAFSAARGNTNLTVTVDGVTDTVTVPDGNYTAAQMTAALKALLDTAFAKTFTVSIDPVTMKTTVAVTGSVTVESPGPGLARQLGFPSTVTGTGTVTGSQVADLSPENYVFLDIDELDGLSAQCLPGGSSRRVFAKIPLKGSAYEYNFYDMPASFVTRRPAVARLSRLRVALRFHDGGLVDLNGGEWSFSLELNHTLARSG